MSDMNQKMFLESETAFGLNVLSTIPVNESFVFSPLSIALALSLVHAGAKDDTKSQISNAILNGANDDELVKHFSNISQHIQNSKNGVQMNIGNRIFANDSIEIRPEYLRLVEKEYDAGAETLDFSKAKESAEKINNYVSEKTKGKIDSIVTEDYVKGASALIINCVYFKSDWSHQFNKHATQEMDFSRSASDTQPIPFMNMLTKQRYSSNDNFQVLFLEYKDASYSFAIFLPNVKYGLKDSLGKLDAQEFQSLLANRTKQNIFVQIPKLKITKEIGLKNILKSVGIEALFTDSADLSGIADNLKISDAIHKALIEVDETGTVAAAVTAVEAMPMSLSREEEPITFTADHPFLFALLKDNHPFFLGVFQG